MGKRHSYKLDAASELSSTKDKGFFAKAWDLILLFFKNITIEPIFFLFGINFTTGIITPTLYYDKICKVGSFWFGNGTTFSEDVCDHIDNGNYSAEQHYVQAVYSQVHLVTSYGGAIPSILVVLFLGPWSDKGGRRLLILSPIVGYIISTTILLLNSIFFYELKVEYMMLEIIHNFFGGSAAFFMGCYSYISDITNHRTRTSRISFLDGVVFLAMTIGYPVFGAIFASYGYVAVYSTAIGALVLAFFYGIFIVKDSLEVSRRKAEARAAALRKKLSTGDKADPEPKEIGSESGSSETEKSKPDKPEAKTTAKHIFSLKNAFHSFHAAFRKRDFGMRHVVLLLLSLFFLDGVASGASVVDFSYTKLKFEWEDNVTLAKWWSNLSSFGGILGILAVGMVGPVMSRILKMSDMLIVSIAMFGKFMCYFVFLIAEVRGLLYLAETCRMLADFASLGIRASLIRIVGQEDTGKIFACVALVQASTLFVFPMYNWIYLVSLDWHYGLVYCIADTILIFLIGISFYCYIRIKKFNKHVKKTLDHIEVGVITVPGVNHDADIPVLVQDEIYK